MWIARLLVAVLVLVAPASHAAEPVASFEVLIKRAMKTGVPKPTAFYVEESQYWTVQTYTFLDATYDVRKTDSMVSPVVGRVTFKMLNGLAGFDSEPDARAAAKTGRMPTLTLPYAVTLDYAFTKGRWELRSGRIWDEYPSHQPDDFTMRDVAARPGHAPFVALRRWILP